MVFGLVMISSVGVALSKLRFDDPYYFFKHQFFYGFLPGLLLMFFAQKVDYRVWKKLAFFLFLINIGLLILTFIPGISLRFQGASRWLKLWAFSFQPSEMLKLTLILYLAAWFDSVKEKSKDFFEGFIPFLVIIGFIGFLIIKQPDMGTMIVLVAIAFSIYFVSGAKLKHIILLMILGVTSFWLLIRLEAYRFKRILAFLNPEIDPQGISYQIKQAIIAIGSGGLWGLGLGHSRQKFSYLPEPVGDSIFAVICEELGFVGACLLLILFAIFALRGYKIAKNAPDNFSRLLATGITSWIAFQAIMNISAIAGLIPLTGVTLPFISYGGTSLVFSLTGAGILLNISKNCAKME